MSLPFDISTSLWLRSVPVWEWEAVTLPGDDASQGACGASADGAASPTGIAPLSTPPPDPSSGERPGFRLVFKGYEIAATVFWLPADSPLSRPWQVKADEDHRPERAQRRPPLPEPEPAIPPATDPAIDPAAAPSPHGDGTPS